MAVQMLQAVRGFCEERGLLGSRQEVSVEGPARHLRALLRDMEDYELSMLMADIDVFERTGVQSEKMKHILDRVELLGRCDRIMPGL